MTEPNHGMYIYHMTISDAVHAEVIGWSDESSRSIGRFVVGEYVLIWIIESSRPKSWMSFVISHLSHTGLHPHTTYANPDTRGEYVVLPPASRLELFQSKEHKRLIASMPNLPQDGLLFFVYGHHRIVVDRVRFAVPGNDITEDVAAEILRMIYQLTHCFTE